MAIRKIGIAGAGIMGSSMARIFAEHDYAVTLYNHQQPRLDKVKEDLGKLADKIVFTTDLKVLADNELILENLPESASRKRRDHRCHQHLRHVHQHALGDHGKAGTLCRLPLGQPAAPHAAR